MNYELKRELRTLNKKELKSLIENIYIFSNREYDQYISEYIFNEAVNINNILLPQTKDRDGGIVQVSVDRGTSKRELQDIKNKFRLANIDLREVTPEPKKPVGKPVSKKAEDKVVRKLAEGKPLTSNIMGCFAGFGKGTLKKPYKTNK